MRRLFLLLLVACSEHGEQPPPDCTFDCDPPVTGPIAVRIVHDGAPVPDVRVVFMDNGGLPIAQQRTGADGETHVILEAGADVTIVDPFGLAPDGAHDLRTVIGARIGDTLELVQDDRPNTLTVSVTAPIEPTAVRYEVHTSCGNGTLVKSNGLARGQVTLASCNGIADILVVTFDANDTLSRALFQAAVPVADGDTVALSDPYGAIPATTITYSGIDGLQVDATTTLASARGALLEQPYAVTFANGIAKKTLAIPPLADSLLITESLPVPDSFEIGQQHVLDWQDAQGEQFVQLFDALLPRLLSAPEFSAPRSVFWGESSFATHTLELLDAPPPPEAQVDFVRVQLVVTRGAMVAMRWMIQAPHSPSFLAIPRLPIELADVDLAGGDDITVPRLELGRVAGGYDTVRALLLNLRRPRDLIVGTSGRTVFEELR